MKPFSVPLMLAAVSHLIPVSCCAYCPSAQISENSGVYVYSYADDFKAGTLKISARVVLTIAIGFILALVLVLISHQGPYSRGIAIGGEAGPKGAEAEASEELAASRELVNRVTAPVGRPSDPDRFVSLDRLRTGDAEYRMLIIKVRGTQPGVLTLRRPARVWLPSTFRRQPRKRLANPVLPLSALLSDFRVPNDLLH